MKVTVEMGNIRKECFVLMPFGPKFDPIYEEVLRPAIEQVGLSGTRADAIYGSRRIMQDIWTSIATSRIIIAELTGRNPNVLYELGLAHALGKPFVIITNSMEDVPFDLKDVRCIVYDKDHPKWGESLTRNVARTMGSILEETSDHEPLFSNIATDTEYSVINVERAKEKREENKEDHAIVDLSGYWRLTQNWPAATDTIATLYLDQAGSSLSGYTVSSPLPEARESEWIVSQEMSGFVRENRFELTATSYQIVENASETFSWNLDNFRGKAENTDFIHGEAYDEKGQTGSFWGERVQYEEEQPTLENSVE